jgi:hypothetical protein
VHPKIAARIASNLSRVKRTAGVQQAAKWWGERFPNMAKTDYDQVVEVLRKREGKDNVTR